MGKGLAYITVDADAAGAVKTRLDDRVTAASGCRSYSPLEGAPGFRRDTQYSYSRAEAVDQGFGADSIHYES